LNICLTGALWTRALNEYGSCAWTAWICRLCGCGGGCTGREGCRRLAWALCSNYRW
jgi:hypothetical protein